MIAIEKKSTGTTLLSILKKRQGLNLIDIERTAASGCKTDRFLTIQPYAARRQITFPLYGKHNELCIKHMSKITANNTHAHDDLADCAHDAVDIALIRRMIIRQTDIKKDTETAKRIMGSFARTQQIKDKRYGQQR